MRLNIELTLIEHTVSLLAPRAVSRGNSVKGTRFAAISCVGLALFSKPDCCFFHVSSGNSQNTPLFPRNTPAPEVYAY